MEKDSVHLLASWVLGRLTEDELDLRARCCRRRVLVEVDHRQVLARGRVHQTLVGTGTWHDELVCEIKELIRVREDRVYGTGERVGVVVVYQSPSVVRTLGLADCGERAFGLIELCLYHEPCQERFAGKLEKHLQGKEGLGILETELVLAGAGLVGGGRDRVLEDAPVAGLVVTD